MSSMKHVERRAVTDLAVNTTGFGDVGADRHIFVEGAGLRARHHAEDVLVDIFLALVLVARQRLGRPPVVGDLVVVPLREHWDFGH